MLPKIAKGTGASTVTAGLGLVVNRFITRGPGTVPAGDFPVGNGSCLPPAPGSTRRILPFETDTFLTLARRESHNDNVAAMGGAALAMKRKTSRLCFL